MINYRFFFADKEHVDIVSKNDFDKEYIEQTVLDDTEAFIHGETRTDEDVFIRLSEVKCVVASEVKDIAPEIQDAVE